MKNTRSTAGTRGRRRATALTPLLAFGLLSAALPSAQELDGSQEQAPRELGPREQEPQESGATDEELPGPPLPELPPLQGDAGPSVQDIQQELIQLFHTVERKLEEVDFQLAQAGTGVLPLEAPEDAGLDDLLRGAMQASQELTGNIDRMLELAQQMGGMQQQQQGQQGQQGQQQQQGQQGDNPLDSRPQGQQQGREQTPEGPRQDGGQDEQEQPGDQNQDGQDQAGHDDQNDPDGDDPDGQNPDGDEDNPDSGTNRPGQDQGGDQGAGANPGRDADRWGELPVRVREVFRNQGREDLPVQYRDWIDAYYRRLNKGD